MPVPVPVVPVSESRVRVRLGGRPRARGGLRGALLGERYVSAVDVLLFAALATRRAARALRAPAASEEGQAVARERKRRAAQRQPGRGRGAGEGGGGEERDTRDQDRSMVAVRCRWWVPTLTWRRRHSVHAIAVRFVRTMGWRRLGSKGIAVRPAAGVRRRRGCGGQRLRWAARRARGGKPRTRVARHFSTCCCRRGGRRGEVRSTARGRGAMGGRERMPAAKTLRWTGEVVGRLRRRGMDLYGKPNSAGGRTCRACRESRKEGTSQWGKRRRRRSRALTCACVPHDVSDTQWTAMPTDRARGMSPRTDPGKSSADSGIEQARLQKLCARSPVHNEGI